MKGISYERFFWKNNAALSLPNLEAEEEATNLAFRHMWILNPSAVSMEYSKSNKIKQKRKYLHVSQCAHQNFQPAFFPAYQ